MFSAIVKKMYIFFKEIPKLSTQAYLEKTLNNKWTTLYVAVGRGRGNPWNQDFNGLSIVNPGAFTLKGIYSRTRRQAFIFSFSLNSKGKPTAFEGQSHYTCHLFILQREKPIHFGWGGAVYARMYFLSLAPPPSFLWRSCGGVWTTCSEM